MAADRARLAIDAMMDMIRDDLAALNIRHEVFFSERSLRSAPSTRSRATIEDLRAARPRLSRAGLPPPKGQPPEDWEDREQTLFRATAFGDDVDRPLMKSDGCYTYFASDIAYHASTSSSAASAIMIDVWGADHGGYVKRMKAAVEARDGGEGRARREALPARAAAARRRAGQDVQALRRLRDAARRGRRGRPRRGALHDAVSARTTRRSISTSPR